MYPLNFIQFGVLCFFVFFYCEVVRGQKGGHYIGCFKEWSGTGDEADKGRFFPDFQQDFDYMTPRLCLEMCSRLGIQYAGLQNGRECFCSRKEPDRTRQTDEGTCGIACTGDANQKCGGYLRLSVYDSGFDAEAVERVPRKQYVGCFKENSEEDEQKSGRYFPEFQQEMDDLHPKLCSDVCFKSGFKFAGIRSGNQCHCTNKELDMNRTIEDMGCQLPCPGDATQKCGADRRLSVYKTGLGEADWMPAGSYVGCFKETVGGRLFEGYGSFIFSDRLTPQLCLQECLLHEYKFSGTQYGLDCRCSNKTLDWTRMTHDEDCNMACFGDYGQACGGFLRISVYHTGHSGPVDNDINNGSLSSTESTTDDFSPLGTMAWEYTSEAAKPKEETSDDEPLTITPGLVTHSDDTALDLDPPNATQVPTEDQPPSSQQTESS